MRKTKRTQTYIAPPKGGFNNAVPGWQIPRGVNSSQQAFPQSVGEGIPQRNFNLNKHAPILGGVSLNLAAGMSVPVRTVRIAFLFSTLFFIGPLLYILLWVLQSKDNKNIRPYIKTLSGNPPQEFRIATKLNYDLPAENRKKIAQNTTKVTFLALALAAIFTSVYSISVGSENNQIIPQIASLSISVVGFGLAWQNIGRTQPIWSQLILGALITVLGDIMIVRALNYENQFLNSLLILIIILLTLGVMILPLWVTLKSQLIHSQEKEIQERTRADMASHLHDSVLQTLALIQSNADDPSRIAALARREERQLRNWLYGQSATTGQHDSIKELLESVVSEVEERYSTPIELIVTHDRKPGKLANPLSCIVREATTNAVKHGKAPVSVYVECDKKIEIFVRDHGPGFSLEELKNVPSDRHGIRDSLCSRAERNGGNVKIRKLKDGTEVHITLPSEAEKTESKKHD
ncbi:PspC domain-containing protein [Actinomycetaceae bacterium TAE3-ERU4]|nr:PspC domain-containing protein [Actinomycetaceae bacterium TAE3-ERU4]